MGAYGNGTENNEGREPGEIDLHGLRAEEAIEFTEQAMLGAPQKGLSQLRLIVGVLCYMTIHGPNLMLMPF